MAYNDKEKQREFQRKWVAKRKVDEVSTCRGLVTYEELRSISSVSKFKTPNECIEYSKLRVRSRHIDRLKIAAAALRVVEIKSHGGDRRTKEWKSKLGPTLVDFASKINVNRKTLYNWVKIYELSEHVKAGENFDYSSADLAVRATYRTKKSPLEEYEKIKWNPNLRNRSYLIRHAKNTLRLMPLLKDLEEPDRDIVINIIKKCMESINKAGFDQ